MNVRVGSPFARWFASIGLGDRLLVGTKGANLGELDRAGVRVPPGFVVTTAAFERMLTALDAESSVRTRIANLNARDLPGVRNACAEIRERIESVPLPPELHAVLAEAYRDLEAQERDIAVAVRSSVTTDDSSDASFAGLQDTYLWVRGVEGVEHCVRSCWASLYNPESVSERLRRRLPENTVAMGVVVQRMVNAHCSGVMLTRSRNTADRSVIIIEASWGLGSCVVSGEVRPDRFVVSKVTGDIVKRTVSEKLTQHLPDVIAGGVRREPVRDELRAVQCLTDAQINELAHTAKRIERHFGSAQSIEWAIAHGERGVYLLQSRPEAARSGEVVSPVAEPGTRTFDHVVSLLSERQRG